VSLTVPLWSLPDRDNLQTIKSPLNYFKQVTEMINYVTIMSFFCLVFMLSFSKKNNEKYRL